MSAGLPDRYAVAGNPVEHSQSPFIHAAFARQTGQAVDYGRLLCPLDGFADAVRRFASDTSAGRVCGCNVTVPFKFEAFTLAPRCTPCAALAQAANTLRFDAEGWLADNTDGIGLVRDIERNAGVPLAGRRLLLIGAGGAAAGALGPLLDAAPAELVVANRTLAKASPSPPPPPPPRHCRRARRRTAVAASTWSSMPRHPAFRARTSRSTPPCCVPAVSRST
jgi:shikimate dehydrogenase